MGTRMATTKLTPVHLLAQNALDAQSAPNLGAVSKGLAEAVRVLRQQPAAEKFGWCWAYQHPICYLFAVQIGHLAKAQILADLDEYAKAENYCRVLVESETEMEHADTFYYWMPKEGS